jgi:hypothetical protein
MGINWQGVKLIINGHLTPSLRMNGCYSSISPIRLYGMASKGTILFLPLLENGARALNKGVEDSGFNFRTDCDMITQILSGRRSGRRSKIS